MALPPPRRGDRAHDGSHRRAVGSLSPERRSAGAHPAARPLPRARAPQRAPAGAPHLARRRDRRPHRRGHARAWCRRSRASIPPAGWRSARTRCRASAARCSTSCAPATGCRARCARAAASCRPPARSLQHKLGRQPSHEEVALALDIDLETYWRWQEEVDGRVLLHARRRRRRRRGARAAARRDASRTSSPAIPATRSTTRRRSRDCARRSAGSPRATAWC